MPKDPTLPLVSRRGVLAAAGVLAAPAVLHAQAQVAGVALVIGNSKYKWEASLPNVRRDAPDIAKRFQALGLKTELVQDASRDTIRSAIDKFASAARGANLAAFYFAGHGASWDKDTYLVPEDADLSDPSNVQTLLPVRAVNAAVKEAQHRLLVFDTCRNNPADGWRQRAAVESSLVTKTELAATVLQGPNTLALFSTAPGRVAVDGPAGENSPFAAAFLKQLAVQSVDLQTLPAKLRRELLIATEGRQVLWDQSTYDQPFPLSNAANRPAASTREMVAADPGPPTGSTQIVELPNAYAFAREKGLLLPQGLVAFRRSSGSPDSQKIGSFKTTIKAYVGTSLNFGVGSPQPLLLVVLSVNDGSAAEIIVSTRDWYGLGGAGGNIWRFLTGTFSGSRLAFKFGPTATAGGQEEATLEFKWRDVNSGTHSRKYASTFSSPFARLD